ncbi:MAG TPA: tryptophan synthase subunit alpha, partial [Actinomycetota bacterium]|nr:tryptophan synthase subunit alpha [Actinomycetota bacterium]
ALLEHLSARSDAGRKLLVPYLMGGIPEPTAFPETLRAVAAHADVVEVGLPYSDPLMDGPVIAAAGERALRAGVGPIDALRASAEVALDVPAVAMTYYNPIHRLGEREFCALAADASFGGLIVPDLPVEESEGVRAAAADAGLAWIPLVAPTSSPRRVEMIVSGATGFVYAVSTLGVTGERGALSERAAKVVSACRTATDLPILVGIGVSTPKQALEATAEADGVVIGSAVVRLVLEEGAGAASAFLGTIREALDGI